VCVCVYVCGFLEYGYMNFEQLDRPTGDLPRSLCLTLLALLDLGTVPQRRQAGNRHPYSSEACRELGRGETDRIPEPFRSDLRPSEVIQVVKRLGWDREHSNTLG